jgi:hypothetical protein
MSDKIYLCKHCGEKDTEKFYSNRFSSCKKCKNKISNNATKIQTREETLSKIILDRPTELLMEKYICSYQKLFNNRSIKEILEILEEKIKFLELSNKEGLEEIKTFALNLREFNENSFNFKTIVQHIENDVKNFKIQILEETKELKNEINELREENRQMKILLQNFLQASK